jgi:hypothetical protein
MSEKVKNTIVVLEPSAKSAAELIKLLEEKDAATIIKVGTPEEAIQNIVSNLPCMFLTSINDNQDVPNRIQLFKRLEGAIKHHGLKVYLVTPIKNRQLSDMITQKMGVTDYIVEPVPVRTMQFKANLQLKAVDNFRRQQEIKKAAEEKVVIKKLDNAKKTDPAGNAEIKTNSKPAVQAGADTFLFKNSGVKKAGKKFTVELEGPDPSTGEWVQHEDKGDAQAAWRWVPEDEKEKQAKGEVPPDGWVHKGEKPVFNETSQKWAMSSETPSLALHEGGKATAQKLGLDENGEVFVAEDSPAAEENLKKNREKAVVEKKRKEVERKSAKELLGGDDGDDSVPRELEQGAQKEGDEKTAGKRKPGGGVEPGSKADLKSLLGGEAAEEESVSAGVLHDKRDPSGKKEGTPLLDKRGDPGRKLEDIVPGKDASTAGEEAAPAGPAKPKTYGEKQAEAKERHRKRMAGEKDEPTPLNNFLDGQDPAEAGAGAPKDRRSKKPGERSLDSLAKLLGGEDDREIKEDDGSPLGAGGGETPAEDGAGGTEDGRPAMKTGSGRAKGRAKALREDPASQRGELNDLQEEGEPETQAELRDLRSKTASEIKALLESPLPDSLEPEEEAAIREELGLQGRPEIKAKDLAKRKRLKKAKELKDKLAELDDKLNFGDDEESGEAHSSAGLDPTASEDVGRGARKRGDLTPDKLKGITGAYDGGEAEEDGTEEEKQKRQKSREEERKKRAAAKDKAEYVPQDQILPLGNAWEAADGFYVYLDAKVRYKGFGKLEDLIPLWIFEGEDVPQLLDKTKQWRFLGGRPFQAASVAEIPGPVRDFLVGLRDQLLRAEGKDIPPEEETIAGEFSAEEAEEESASPAGVIEKKPKAKGAGRARDLGKGLEELLGDDGDDVEDETPDDSTDLSEEESGEETSGSGLFSEEEKAKKKIRQSKERSSRLSKEARALLDEAEEERAAAQGEEGEKTENEKEEKEDPLARLRAKLGMDEPAEESEATGKTRPEEVTEEEKAPARSLDDLAASLEEEPASGKKGSGDSTSGSGDSGRPADPIATLSKSSSEGVQKFLERRKKKLEEAVPETKAAEPAREPQAGYLGIYVALSDAYSTVAEAPVSLARVLGSIEGSFKNCVAYVTTAPDESGNVRVRLHSPGASVASELLPLAGGVSEAITANRGGTEEVLGYLYLGATGTRAGFEPTEENTFRRLAKKVWPLVIQLPNSAERKAA